jgi:opacity protein-like surface antigen
MKVKILIMVMFVFLDSIFLYAQTKKDAWELSLSGYIGTIKTSFEWDSPYGSEKSEGEAESYVIMAFRPGYYITEEVVIEPEFIWTAQEEIKPGFAISANLAYNYNIPNSPSTIFALIGYGLANGITISQRLLGRPSDELDISVFNIGAGVKIFISEPIAFRVEYRYQSFSHEDSSGNFTSETTTTFNTILMGFSVFL